MGSVDQTIYLSMPNIAWFMYLAIWSAGHPASPLSRGKSPYYRSVPWRPEVSGTASTKCR